MQGDPAIKAKVTRLYNAGGEGTIKVEATAEKGVQSEAN